MSEDPIYTEAISLFRALHQRVQELDMNEPDAMALATSDGAGYPTNRIILLRGFDERGFVFFTNSESRKGEQLLGNPRAALCFYWDAWGQQVRVEGTTQRVVDEESDLYWSRRARTSQLASLASLQSRELDRRETYENRIKELEQVYAGTDVPRPDHWYGFRVVPDRIEFWENRENRMHHRTVYQRRDTGWVKFLLYP